MNGTNYQIDSSKGLLTYLKTVGSSVKIQRKGAEILLADLSEHNVQLYTDKEANLYMKIAEKEAEQTTIDDVVDLVCEYNYEEIYETEEKVISESDFVSRCKLEKKLEDLKREKQILDKIFYHTKYGRKVGVVADRICAGLCEKFNLVPVYNVPMYEDKLVSEESAYETASQAEPSEVKITEHDTVNDDLSEDIIEEAEVSDDHIVTSEAVPQMEEPTRDERKETKGAR
ncbi:MAG TPA: hypothetical protein DHV96_09835 [Lachnospiraceae bacterium]|nr:hypothetical protein [Lachnospiraceae bacterium]